MGQPAYCACLGRESSAREYLGSLSCPDAAFLERERLDLLLLQAARGWGVGVDQDLKTEIWPPMRAQRAGEGWDALPAGGLRREGKGDIERERIRVWTISCVRKPVAVVASF